MKAATIFIILFTFSMINIIEASFYKNLDYDDVRKAGGFSSKNMLYVSRISSSDTPLDEAEKSAILNSETLCNLHTLDLSNQAIDDNFIETLSKNPHFRRIINLDLSGNLGITDSSVKYLLESPNIGSIRDLPQVSSRYGCLSTTVYLRAVGTNIKNFNNEPCFNFCINYKNPVTGEETHDHTEHAVKFVEVTM
jgi:hypothetical protein